ncbi:vacuolar protein sorting-associated protein 16 [Auricularia subglabra TFB-10046 SS5]|uniref:Probable vacuolar protein sorting-associated protein 16 homolog n=1 Tax=Auricularia subglabra (strain TFB-10046 / SS5) TaxID=717982 RepID=J0D239_AURST|nr:vacuolar protein sorting-associated protein 16 [Auricularia subglabra TFB-10046 SS5]
MDDDHPTASWDAMPGGSAFYRKLSVYQMQWPIRDLSDYIVAGARYGGPLALMRDPTKMVAMTRMGSSSNAKQPIQIFSSSGDLISTVSWDQGRIIRIGWTLDERLVALNEEGIYRLYDLQGDYVQHSLGPEAGETGVIDARIYENGLVAMTGLYGLLEVKGWAGGKSSSLASTGLTEPPHSWSIIAPDVLISRHVEVLLATEATIIAVDALEAADQHLARGPFSHVAPSPNGKRLALLTAANVLWVVSADFQNSLVEFDVDAATAHSGAVVRYVQWCGDDAVFLGLDGMTLLVGPGPSLQYFYASPTFAVSEIDGIRVFSADTCDFIQKVPNRALDIFLPGSTEPSAILYDAWAHFTQRSPRADEAVRHIRPDLASAVDACIEVAGWEWGVKTQRALLNAAKYGRAFLDSYNPTDFVLMGQTLKVLNAVRYYEIGIPITYAQYLHTSPSHLLVRLTARSQHLLALRIASYLSMKPDAVLKHWASAKIARAKKADGSAEDDATICRTIVEKFEQLGGGEVSYADIARRAWEVGRLALAIQLLEHEPRPADQVPLLLEMKDDRRALIKAVDSGDTDLVYTVLLALRPRLQLGDFFRLVEEGGPRLAPAASLLQVYARQQDREMLRDFYYADDRRVASAVLALEEASGIEDPVAKMASIKAAQKFFSEDKDRAFEAKMMDENIKLMAFQLDLEKEVEHKVKFVGLSVSETIKTCLVNGLSKKADKVKKDWVVPDKRFWHIKLQALTQIGDFDALEAFAKSKKSPIGYEPFVHHLAENGHLAQAAIYVPRCDASKRVDLYVACRDWQAAGKECIAQKDKAALENVVRICTDSLARRELEQMLRTLGG